MQRRVVIVGCAVLLGAGALAYALDRPAGYGVSVDVQKVLGPPPAAASPEAAAERAGFARTVDGIGGPRWRQAATEIHPSGPEVTAEISCAAGRRLSAATTPVTMGMIGNAVSDLTRAVDAGKTFYKRDRPYVGNADTRTCDPRTLGALGGSTGGVLSYAYPSGHAAQGRLVARIMAVALPDRAAALSAWGDHLGDNRVICRVHWPSDVAAGRRLGDAVFAALNVTPAFRSDLVASRAELAKAPAATGCPA